MKAISFFLLIAFFSCLVCAVYKKYESKPVPSHPADRPEDYSFSYGKESQPSPNDSCSRPGEINSVKLSESAFTSLNPNENLGFSRRTQTIFYQGLCDASAVVALDQTYFVVGDDEDNVLRVYHRLSGGHPVYSLELSAFLRVDPKSPEVDIEAADRIGERIYWISSHGRTVKGKEATSRQRFFATTGTVIGSAIDLKPVGQPYMSLLGDLLADPRLSQFGLAAAALKPPKTPGALNIEGLSVTPEGCLLIGFRNPIPQGRALLVPLLNPADLIQGTKARFGYPILLELGGRGIRSITLWRGQYLIVAGSNQNGGQSQFYLWDGFGPPHHLAGIWVGGLNPEAVAFWDPEGYERLYIVSDDGTQCVGGVECKKLKNSAWKRFRAICLD